MKNEGIITIKIEGAFNTELPIEIAPHDFFGVPFVEAHYNNKSFVVPIEEYK